ncbi:nicotinate-nucleotide--dimethylbenzimidazole phosphoribosyltransferase, partial [Saccharomonospora saliphila]|uniref:nicotinate-nucleotide--dimethylbenzimidazole phosphoribosyltransferase n=1 Tax=Saccharomonospora saliphila TaxID=369829 RepID=UPI00066226A4
MPVEFADVPALFDVADAPPARRRPRFGTVAELGSWLATCQGAFPPRPLSRPRLVVFAADHGIAAREVS